MSEVGPIPGTALPAGTPPTVDQAKRVLSRDFYGSFRFAQGNGDIQHFLFNALATTYSQLWTPEGMHAVLPEALEAARERTVSTAPPVKHLHLPAQKVGAEATKQWEAFSATITKAASATNPRTGITYGILRRLMPLWDARQVALGRYDRPTEEETYESYYRTYVLDGQPTRSEAFDRIFASLRKRQLGARPPMTLNFLQAAWELRHNDEPFYPESFQRDLKNSPLLVRLGYLSLTRHIPLKVLIQISARAEKPRNLQTRELPVNEKDA